MSTGAEHHVVVPYPATNSSVRTRALEWIDRFGARSSNAANVVVHGPGFDAAAVAAGRDVLLLRNARRFTRGGYESRLLTAASVGVYDLDDGLPWDDGNLPGLGRWWKRPWPRSLVARRAASASDRVIAGNQIIADWASQWCDDVRIVPTCVEPTDYTRRTSWGIDGQTPVVGWIGSPATQGYLLDIADGLRRVHELTGARLEVIGGDATALASIDDFATVIDWHPTESNRRIATWDVGIMPLRDGVYERAKCGYKLLQYAASGVPAVASPVGANVAICQGMGAPTPSTSGEWADALIGLIESPASTRADMAALGIVVAADHSYDTWYDRWIDAVGWDAAPSPADRTAAE